MGKISGAASLSRFARTIPQWQNQTRRVFNPASISWQPAATTGSNSYTMSATDTSQIFPNTAVGYQYTIAFWINPRSWFTGSRGVMQLEDASGNDVITFMLQAPNMRVVFNSDHTNEVVSTGSMSLNAWNHVIFQSNEADCVLTVNGVSTSYPYPSQCPDLSVPLTWRLGKSNLPYQSGTITEIFDGLMSDIMVVSGAEPNNTQRIVLYNNGGVFNLGQSAIAPVNPLLANMTFLCDGTKTGVMLNLGTSRLVSSNIAPNIKRVSFTWSGNLQNVPDLDGASRPAPSSTTYSRFASLVEGWNNNLALATTQGTTIRPLPSASQSIQTVAPALLPYPFAGWGFKSETGYFHGNMESPEATPLLTVSGTLTEQGTASNPMVGSGTLQGSLDAREVRFLRPTFARKV